MRRLAASLLTLVAAMAFPGPGAKADFQSKTVRIVVPFTPGGPGDIVSRAFGNEFAKVTGATVIVENKPGGGTAIGTQTVVHAPADGYTLLFGTTALVSTMLGLKKPGYEMSDLTPVTVLGEQSYVFIISGALGIKTLPEFVAYAKKNSSKLNYGTLGAGTGAHVLADRFQRAAAFEWQDIAFRGAAPTIQALMANDVQGYFTTQSSAITYKDSDKVTIMAVATDARSPFLPDVPTFKEKGYDVVERSWYAMFVRSGTPKEMVLKLREAAARTMATPEMQQHLKQLGLSPFKDTLAVFEEQLKGEEITRAEDNRRLGIEPQ